MIKINDLEIIDSKTLIIHKDESAEFAIKGASWTINIILSFNDNKESQSISVRGEKNTARLTFNKWSASTGTCLTKPSEIASLGNGDKILFTAFNLRVRDVNQITVQFMIRKKAK